VISDIGGGVANWLSKSCFLADQTDIFCRATLSDLSLSLTEYCETLFRSLFQRSSLIPHVF
jgi:hypothetical protein